jgi:ribonuclease Y
MLLLLLGGAALGGVAFGYFLRFIVSLGKRGSMELEIKQMELKAREEADAILATAKQKAEELETTSKEEAKERESKLSDREEKISKNEERLIKKDETLTSKQQEIEKEVDHIKNKIAEVKEIKDRAEKLEQEKLTELEKVASLSKEDAKQLLVTRMETEAQEDLMVRLQKLEVMGREKIEEKAKDILVTAIHRFGNAVNTEVMTTSVPIPSEEIKGKIIGKEGRNIKAFERATGVDVLVDETPGVITLSSFDPIRRQIAKFALQNLILDGRIQPAKIEELVEKTRLEINKIIKEQGEKAAYECGIHNLDPRIIAILGRLHFRTSYGQNVLQHSIEMAHLAGILAQELGANVYAAKAGALLHDIGKSVDHEVQGTHVEIGRRILEKFGADKAIIQAMQAHHEEYPYETVESIIVQVVDAISGGRPGARSDSVENYIKRLGDLEKIATSFDGVEKSYAIQAGRELRIFVYPEKIGDLEAKKLAREIALRIEQELKYPGEIKVNVIRESRAVEFAR